MAVVVLASFAASSPVLGKNPALLSTLEQSSASTTHPLPPDYRIHSDGAVTQRVCFNWSCKSRQRITYSAADMKEVARQMALCPGNGMHERLQRLRIGIWQMEVLAEKYQPRFANDAAVNDRDAALDGRMDCIDNASNTTSYLSVLRELGLLSDWSIGAPSVRHKFSYLVHWTAVVIDGQDNDSWAVDAWLRPNGHLPFVLPLGAWKDDQFPWDPPLGALNPAPAYSSQLCIT